MCRRNLREGTRQPEDGNNLLDPEVDTMRWMKECQHSYMDAQLDFWLLLRPLTDGGKESSRHLMRRLLSIWHWASALDPPICPPAPFSAWHRPLAVGGLWCRWYAMVDWGLHVFASMHGWGLCGSVLDSWWAKPWSQKLVIWSRLSWPCHRYMDSPTCH